MAQTPAAFISKDCGQQSGYDNDPHPAITGGVLVKRVSVASAYVGEEQYYPSGGSLASGGASFSASVSSASMVQDIYVFTDSGKFDLYYSDDGNTFYQVFTVIPGVRFRLNFSGKQAWRVVNPYGANCNYYVILVR